MSARVDPLAYAVLLPTVLAAHTIADHVVQTDAQAAGKAKVRGWARPMAGHIAGYQATQLVAVLAVAKLTGLPLARGPLLAGSLVSAVTHAFLDRRWPVTRLLRATGSGNFGRGVIPGREVLTAPGSVHASHPSGAEERKPPHVVIPDQPLPIHGPYLADQSLHTGCLAVAAALMAWRSR